MYINLKNLLSFSSILLCGLTSASLAMELSNKEDSVELKITRRSPLLKFCLPGNTEVHINNADQVWVKTAQQSYPATSWQEYASTNNFNFRVSVLPGNSDSAELRIPRGSKAFAFFEGSEVAVNAVSAWVKEKNGPGYYATPFDKFAEKLGLPTLKATLVERAPLNSEDKRVPLAPSLAKPTPAMLSPTQLAEALGSLNPHMTESLAQCWAAYPFEILPVLFRTNTSNEDLTFSTRDGVSLYVEPIPGDGRCGYWAQDLTPARAHAMLVDGLTNPTIRAMIANEIKEAVLAGQPLPFFTGEVAQMKSALDDLEADIGSLISALKTFAGLPEATVTELNQVALLKDESNQPCPELKALNEQVERKMLLAEQFPLLLDPWTNDPATLRAYLDLEVKDGVELTYLPQLTSERGIKLGVIDALAELGGYNLTIYQKTSILSRELNVSHMYQRPTATARTVELLYTPGGGPHYDRLHRSLLRLKIPS